MDPIVVQGVSKRFRRYQPDRPHTFKDLFLKRARRLRAGEPFWALRDVSFNVRAGEMMGVVGANGAGKSTLLRLIGGVGRVDGGTIQTRGRIGALLELGADFHPDLTGRENVFTAGIIAGMRRHEVSARFADIVSFAELESFIDSPVRTYSTGMQMRLAFSVAVHVEPTILLIDEVLAVGDIGFQQKCLERIEAFKEEGGAVLLVSHDMDTVTGLSDRLLWLRDGQLMYQGEPEEVAEQYVAAMDAETRRRTRAAGGTSVQAAPAGLQLGENRFGSLEMQITGTRLLSSGEREVTGVESGAPLRVAIAYQAPEPIAAPIFSVTISTEEGNVCLDTNTADAGVPLPTLQGSGEIVLEIARLDLVGDDYFVDVGVYEGTWAYAYDYHWHVYPLLVQDQQKRKGVLSPPLAWSLSG